MFDGGNPVYSIMENDTLVTQFTTTDPDGDSLKYNLDREDARINRHGNFRWRPSMHVNSINGSREMFVVTIYDECGLSTTIIVTVGITFVLANFVVLNGTNMVESIVFGLCKL